VYKRQDFPKSIEGLRPTLQKAKDFGAPFVVVIGQVMPVHLDDMVPVIRAWLALSEEVGVPIQFETHRNCITNDLYTTLCLLDAVPDMRLCADLSHYVVAREIALPIAAREQGQFERILARSDSFQGRVASRNQVQLPLNVTHARPWIEQFKTWWRAGFQEWRARNANGTCVFACELGPPDYAWRDADGQEVSNRWHDALTIKAWVDAIWADLDEAEKSQSKS